jgi:hypothetical protein
MIVQESNGNLNQQPKHTKKFQRLKIHENVIAERFRTRKQTMFGIAMNHECKHRKQGASREVQD